MAFHIFNPSYRKLRKKWVRWMLLFKGILRLIAIFLNLSLYRFYCRGLNLDILFDPLAALISFLNFIFFYSSFSCFYWSFLNELFSLIDNILNSLTILILIILFIIAFLLANIINQWLYIFVWSIFCPCILCMNKIVQCTLIIWSFINLFPIIIFQFQLLFPLLTLKNLLILNKHFCIILRLSVTLSLLILLASPSYTLFRLKRLFILPEKILIFLQRYMFSIQLFRRIPP